MNASAPDIRQILPPRSVVLAPMAGIAEAPFRAICKRMGATLTYTEMVSAKALKFSPESRQTRLLLTLAPEETPCGVQLFGADPELMAEQAAALVGRLGSDVALVDVNMGCPVAKVVARGEGSALMRTPELAAEVVRQMVAALSVPVTVKVRKGWDLPSANAVEFALAMQDAGAAAITVHGRTRSQGYHGRADWGAIGAVKSALSVPVIGSGDVESTEAVMRMFHETGVDGVAVARGAQGNPWIFRECRALLDDGTPTTPPTALERVDMAAEHTEALIAFGGEQAHRRMRKHVGWYVKGLPGATHVRQLVNRTQSSADMLRLLAEYRAYLANKNHPTESRDESASAFGYSGT